MSDNSNYYYEIPTNDVLPNKKVVFITAIYGDYESSCKPYAKQTIPTDFICFTNNNHIISNNWEVDTKPYHKINPSAFDDGSYLNSLKNNNHTFNLAKYYKQSFHNIPKLKEYDIVVWLDGTKEITNPKTSEWIANQIELNPIIAWEHKNRKGSLKAEVEASISLAKYSSKFWFNQPQPFQEIQAQYHAYIQDNYNEDLWTTIAPERKNFGVWNTGFIAFNNKNDDVHKFLDLWYLQTLRYSTQDQVSFPYVVQKLHLYPYTLPNSFIKGDSTGNYLFVKHYHKTQNAAVLGAETDPTHATLHLATTNNDTQKVKEILESRSDFRLKAPEYSLYTAITKNNYEISKMLLEYGIEINFMHSGGTVLYWAAQEKNFEGVKILLEAGANPEIKAINNMTPLVISVQEHHFNITKLLIEAGANIEETNGLGATPLYLASYFGYDDIVKLLLDHGANKNIHVNGINAFQRALQRDHQSTAQLLAGGKEEFCQEIQKTEFEEKYSELCGEIKIELEVES